MNYGMVELFYLNGPFSFESEFLQARVGTQRDAKPTISGFYVQSSFVFSGGERTYSKGVPGGVEPGATVAPGNWPFATVT